MELGFRKTKLANHFYVSRQGEYPRDGSVIQSTYKNRFSVIEMMREATEEELFVCDLFYIGYGISKDEHIQKHVREYEKNIKKYN
ncbi:MAG TPA: hypothetical protein VIG40_05445 [Tissierellaceae bacterium]